MMDSTDSAFILVSAALVFLMTPGLAFFYGGFSDKKNVLTILNQSFLSLGVSSLLWYLVGYSLCFSGDVGGVIGNLDQAFLRGIALTDLVPDTQLPTLVFVSYQMMFAIITPALITGAFINRITFKAYALFLIAWQLVVYYPFAHMIWGGGLLAQWGVLDFAGGIVVHTTAGGAALASVLYVGKRRNLELKPHNVPIIALGTALLWFGWFGFNAGSALGVNKITVLAFLNTQLAATAAAVVWVGLDWYFEGKPKVVGFLIGSIAGLATITPAVGFVGINEAVIMGASAGLVCYLAVMLKNRIGWDDALDVLGVHGIGGMLGIVLLGVFGSTLINPDGADGLLRGGSSFFWKQTLAALGTFLYSLGVTYGLFHLINQITPVRVSIIQEESGLDNALHGEIAYEESLDATQIALYRSLLVETKEEKTYHAHAET